MLQAGLAQQQRTPAQVVADAERTVVEVQGPGTLGTKSTTVAFCHLLIHQASKPSGHKEYYGILHLQS